MTAAEQVSDAELLLRYRGGDTEAFAVLLGRYQTPLYNFVLRSVRNAGVAEDLVQDIFMRVIQHQGEFRRDAKLSTWLYTIARNLCVDHARKARHRRHPSLDQASGSDSDGSPLGERLSDGAVSVERVAGSTALQTRIALAVEELPEDQREVFLLRQLEGLPFADIAEIVGAPENTVKSRMRYALLRLQETLADYQELAEAPA